MLQNDVYVLTGCPSGYRFVNATTLEGGAIILDLTAQRCEPCGLGHECLTQPCTTCEPVLHPRTPYTLADRFPGLTLAIPLLATPRQCDAFD